MIWVQNRVIVLSKRLHLDFKEVSCKSNFNRNYSLTITELCLMLICRVSIWTWSLGYLTQNYVKGNGRVTWQMAAICLLAVHRNYLRMAVQFLKPQQQFLKPYSPRDVLWCYGDGHLLRCTTSSVNSWLFSEVMVQGEQLLLSCVMSDWADSVVRAGNDKTLRSLINYWFQSSANLVIAKTYAFLCGWFFSCWAISSHSWIRHSYCFLKLCFVDGL